MTGNDIVDLNIAQVYHGDRRQRFLDKIFTSREQEIINSGGSEIWLLWAMKEAVYKAHHRRFDLHRSFDPKKIEVNMINSSKISVEARGLYDGHTYWGNGDLTSEYVHINASCDPLEPVISEVHSSASAVRNRLKLLISEKLGLNLCDISIVKNQNFIPQLTYKYRLLDIPFSISHHGEFAAFSFQLINY